MRAAGLLQILLLLQNRGRMTPPALARKLEVTPRTILRDVDALTEAGLPVITHRGVQDGPVAADPRVQAMAKALRDHRLVVLRSGSTAERRFRPERLGCDSRGWWVEGPPLTVREWREDWGNIVIVRPLG